MANSDGQGGSAYPKSVQAGIPRLEVPEGWTAPRIGKLFKVVKRPVALADNEEYQLVTARRNRGGIVARERLRGKDILTKSQFRVAGGDFLISRRQIAHGACGIVPAELDGAVVSNEYAVLRPTDLLDSNFLRHLPHSVYFQQTCFHSSIGVHVEKLVFKIEDWWKWPIPIPSKTLQSSYAEVLDQYDLAIAIADDLVDATYRRLRACIQKLDCEADNKKTELTNFADKISEKVSASTYATSIELEDVEGRNGRILTQTPTGELSGDRTRFAAGDTLFGKLRPYLRKFCRPEFDGEASTEFWVLRARPDLCRPEFLYYLVQTHAFLAEANRPTGSRMPRADWEVVEQAPLPLPTVERQDALLPLLRSADLSHQNYLAIAERLRRYKNGVIQRIFQQGSSDLRGAEDDKNLKREVA